MACRTLNCHRIVTHALVALGYVSVLISMLSMGNAMAKSPTADQIKRTLLDEVRFFRDADLASSRLICAAHYMPRTVRRTEDDGTPHPGTVAMCKSVITESLKRNRGPHLYINLAVTELTGRTGIMDDIDVSKLIKNDEDIQTFKNIRDGAQADQTSYKTVAGRQLQLTTALAIDAGAYAGYRQPQAAIAPSQTDEDIERTITQCYEENSTTSRKACFLAGARFGQSIRRSLDAAAADPSVSKAPTATPQPAQSSSIDARR